MRRRGRVRRGVSLIGLMALISATILIGVAGAAGVWTVQGKATNETLWDVTFVDGARGWAVGNDGAIIATTNAGGTWSAQSSGSNAALFGVSFVNAHAGWVVGSSGTILYTGDGGATWSPQTSGTTNRLEAVDFLDANQGWAVGVGGTIVATTSGGVMWETQETPRTIQINDVSFVDANRGWAVGNSGWVLRTTDGGTTWTEYTPVFTPQDLTGVSFVDVNRGWIVGDAGIIYVTFDGGDSWSAQTSSTTLDLWDVSFADASHGWAVGYNGTIVATANGGATWGSQTSNTTETLPGVSFVDTGHGWAAGGAGTVVAYLDAPPDGVLSSGPASGPPGTVVSARSITSCPAGSTFATIYLKSGTGTTLDAQRAANFSGSGAWSGTVTVPSGATPGPAFVTASCFGTSARDMTLDYSHNAFTITPTLTTITVAPIAPTIQQDATKQFTATGTYSDGSTQDLTSSVIWESSDSSVATISSAGLATGVGLGAATISATSGSVTGATTLTVEPGRPRITAFSPTSGRPGTRVTVTGAHLSGLTSLTFNGVTATFTVQSDSKVTTKVPKGATTGPISVTTPAGTATSASNFVVKK